VIEGGAAALNWHADVAARKSGDVRAPKDFEASRVLNSGGNSRAGAVGGSWADADGHVGAAIDTLRNEYGVVVEPEVTIDMERTRLVLDGERRWSAGPLRELRMSLAGTRYEHQELEGAEVGTTFKSRGQELRLQVQHAPWAGISGVVGVQADALRFSALGDEAFVPNTRTRSEAVFALQSWQSSTQPGALTLTGGLRAERVRVSSEGDAPDAAQPKFGPAQRRSFSPGSAWLAATWALAPGWQLNGQAGLTQRAPTYYELYANGIHVATGAFELGDPTLGLERSGHLELGAQWESDAQGTQRVKAQFFSTRFSRYIALDATGNVVEEVGEGGEVETFPEYAFRAVPARLHGFEIEGRTRLMAVPWQVDAVGQWDLVRGSNRDTGEALPRLAPMRLALGLQARQGPWWASLAVRHSARQRRVPATDVPTPGATVLDVALQWQQRVSDVDVLLFAKLDNLADRLAYNAVALRTARELSPLPGRALTVGARLNW
jgi:iron complex outermembrane recepter protein